MKSTSVVLRLSLVLMVCLGTFAAVSPASARGNRCTDRCADVYRVKKDACRLIPFKTERKICERRAKEAKKDCKHRCR